MERQELNGFLNQGRETEKMGIAFRGIAGVEEPYFNKRKISESSDETGADHRPDETTAKMSYAGGIRKLGRALLELRVQPDEQVNRYEDRRGEPVCESGVSDSPFRRESGERI